MTGQQYKVGQILFVGSNKKNQVVPVQITERVTKENVEGQKIIYSVVTTGHPEKPIDLSRIDGQIFTSLEEAKEKMILNAEKASQDLFIRAKQEINRMVQVAAQASQKFSPMVSSEKEEDFSIDISDEIVDEEIPVVKRSKKEKEPQILEEDNEAFIMVPGPDGTEIKAKVRSIQGPGQT